MDNKRPSYEVTAIDPRLDSLKDAIASDVEVALGERNDMKLSIPSAFSVDIGLGLSDSCNYALAERGDSGNMIKINVLPQTAENVMKGYTDFGTDIQILMGFDYETRRLAKSKDERDTLSMIYDTENMIDKAMCEIEKNKAMGTLDINKEEYLERIPDAIKYLKENKAKARNAVDKILAQAGKCFDKGAQWKYLRHEIDHIDFFDHVLYENWLKSSKEQIEGKKKFYKGQISEDEFIEMSRYAMELDAEFRPILEPRALFFTMIMPGGFKNADFNLVKDKVKSWYVGTYMNRNKEYLLNYILDTMKTSEVNETTKKYIRQGLSNFAGIMDFVEKNRNEPIQYGKMFKISSRDVQEMSYEHMLRVNEATDVIGEAYRVDPSILATTKSAGTFKDYIRMCKM